MSATPLPFPNEASSDPVAAALPVGASVAHLTIERVLHEGPYTIVYRASDPAAPQVPAVALMEYFPRTLALRQPDGALRARQAGDAIALSVGREAFVLEAEALERVLHPGVVRVIGSLQAHRTVYRAMELISGPTLEAFVRERETPPSVGEVAALFDALLDALQAAKAAGATDEQLAPAFEFQRKAQWRLDFIAAENSMGFHAPQEAAMVLGEATDYARQGELAARQWNQPPAPRPTATAANVPSAKP